MQFICPECDKKIKVSDETAGKKIRCPECGTSVPIARKESAVTKKVAPKPKKSRAADDDDDNAREEPAEKSSMGLILALAGGGVMMLFLVLGIVGVWFFFLREPAPGAQANNDSQPAVKEIKVVLANGQVKRFGDRVQMSVDYEVSDAKANDIIGVFLVFPSDANAAEMVKMLTAQDLRGAPKGRWTSPKFMPQPPVVRDTICDIVVRVANDAGQLPKGKEIAKLASVPIPSSEGNAPYVQLSNVVAKQNSTNSRLIDISFDYKIVGAKPASNSIWFESEFVAPGSGARTRLPLTVRAGADLKIADNIVCSAVSPLENTEFCDLLVSDSQPGKGNLAKVINLGVQSAKPSNLVLTLSNPQVERGDMAAKTCKISVNLKAEGKGNLVLYKCAAIFSVQGVKQKPVEFGKPEFGRDVVNGVKIEGTAAIPAGADALCDIIVREAVTGNMTVLAQLNDLPMSGTVTSSGGGKLVAFNNVRIFRIDDFTLQVQFDYEFTKAPDPMKLYTLLIQRKPTKDFKDDPRVCLQMRGDQMPLKGEFNKRIAGNQFGNAKEYRIWAASGQNLFDIKTAESQVNLVRPNTGGVAEGKDVVVSNVKVELIAADKVRVSADFDFLKGPDPKRKYTINVQRAANFKPGDLFNPVLREDTGDKWQKKGQVNGEVQVQGKGDDFRVWMVSTPGFETCSNNVLVKSGGGGGTEPAGAESIQITAGKLTSFGKKGSLVEVTYKFTAGAKPKFNTVYAFILAPKGAQAFPIFQVEGAKMATEGTFPFPTAFVLAKEREFEIYITEVSAGNRVISNKKALEIKKN